MMNLDVEINSDLNVILHSSLPLCGRLLIPRLLNKIIEPHIMRFP